MKMNEATKAHEDTRRKPDREDLILADEVYRVVGAAMEVHSRLGPGFLEAVYEEALGIEMLRSGIPFREQLPLEIHYRGQILRKRYVCDFLAFDAIVLEIKAIPQLTNTEMAQILNHLKATGKPIGLLINFGKTGKLDWQRVMGPKESPDPVP
jgi:GxxExxY protein